MRCSKRDRYGNQGGTNVRSDVDFAAIKKAWRSKAKEVHPDVKPGDADAAKEFHRLQLAYEVLRAAEERRTWQGYDDA